MRKNHFHLARRFPRRIHTDWPAWSIAGERSKAHLGGARWLLWFVQSREVHLGKLSQQDLQKFVITSAVKFHQ